MKKEKKKKTKERKKFPPEQPRLWPASPPVSSVSPPVAHSGVVHIRSTWPEHRAFYFGLPRC